MADDAELKWVEITSFAPGIVHEFAANQGAFAYTAAPLGSARFARGCYALTTGSLVPGWKIVYRHTETPFNNNWSAGYRPPAEANPCQTVCDTGMFTPVMQHVENVAAGNPVGGVLITSGPEWDRPDHLFIGYGEAYDSTGNGPAANHPNDGFPLVYTLVGYLQGVTAKQLPAPFIQTDENFPHVAGTYKGNAYDWTGFFARQNNKVGGSIAVGRSGQGYVDFTATGNNFLHTGVPSDWKPELVWSPMARRGWKVDWCSFPQNMSFTMTGAQTTGLRPGYTYNTNPSHLGGTYPLLWGIGPEQLTTSVFHNGSLVWSSMDSTFSNTYGAANPTATTANPGAEFPWTPAIRWTVTGGGCFYWVPWAENAGVVAGQNNAFGSMNNFTFGDEADEIAWMCSVNATTLMVMFVGRGAYLIKGGLNANNAVRLAGAPNCIYPWTKPVQMGSSVVWSAGNGVFSLAEDGSVQPLSTNLRSDFWVPFQAEGAMTKLLSYSHVGKLNHRDPWVMAPSDYVYDKRTQAWWQLDRGDDPRHAGPGRSDVPFTFYEVGSRGNVYAVDQFRDQTHNETYVVYDPNRHMDQASDIYIWVSNPLHDLDATPGATVDVRRIEFVASGHGTIQMEVLGLTNAPDPQSFVSVFVDTDIPMRFEADVTYRTATDPPLSWGGATTEGTPASSGVVLSITCFGTASGPGDQILPSIHPGLKIGYRQAQGIPKAPAVVTPR